MNETNGNTSAPDQNSDTGAVLKRKKKSCCLGCLVKTLMFFIVVFVVIPTGYRLVTNQYQRYQNGVMAETLSATLQKGEESLSFKLLEKAKENPNEDYDGDGLTNLVEAELGTNPYEWDTSGNGISDGDSINIHQLDPLIYDTSDDGIGDGYKLHFGLDIHKKYSKTEIMELARTYAWEEAEGIELIPDTLESILLAEISMCEIDELKFDKSVITQPRWLRYFTGDMMLDIEEYLAGTEDSVEDYSVYYYDGTSNGRGYIKAKQIYDDNKIIVKVDKNLPFVVRKNPEFSLNTVLQDMGILPSYPKMGRLLFNHNIFSFGAIEPEVVILETNDTGYHDMYTEMAGNRAYEDGSEPIIFESVVTNPLRILMFDLFYSALSINIGELFALDQVFDSNDKLVRFLMDDFKLYYLNTFYFLLDGEKVSTLDSVDEQVGDYGIEDVLMLDSDGGKQTKEESEIKTPVSVSRYNAVTGFDQTKDAFSFQNMGTEISPGGICAGFMLSTSRLYNDPDSVLRTDKLQTLFTDVAYDVHSYDALYTRGVADIKLTDPHYQAYRYEDSIKVLETSLMETEDYNLIRFLEYHYEVGNKNVITTKLFHESNFHDFSNIETLYEKLSADEVVCTAISDDGGHGILTTGMSRDAFNDNLFYLDVYDSNFPNGQRLIYENGEESVFYDSKMVFEVLRTKVARFHNMGYDVVDEYRYNYKVFNGDNNIVFHMGDYDNETWNEILKGESPFEEWMMPNEYFKFLIFFDDDGEYLVPKELDKSLIGIEIVPEDYLTTELNLGDSIGLKVLAHYDDGSQSDITYNARTRIDSDFWLSLVGDYDPINRMLTYKNKPIFEEERTITFKAKFAGYEDTIEITLKGE